MNSVFTLLVSSFILLTGQVFAHSSHSHAPGKPIAAAKVEESAKPAVADLVKRNKIDKSWGALKPVHQEKKVFKGQKEWVVKFENTQTKDPKKKSLFVFLALSGKVLGANFTGK